MISEQLAGKRIAITGATGFLGTALVERLLRCVPDCEVVCITRPTRKFSPLERVLREVVRNDCFDRLREEWGDGFQATIDRRLHAIAGDVSSDELGLDANGLATLATCDVVVHSAATVSFDSPLDAAVEVNLLGPKRVADAINAAGSGETTHLVAVSTAYVVGSRRGDAPEELLTDAWYSPNVDWRAEVTAGRRALADAEYESRQMEKLAEFAGAARKELGGAGTPLLAEKSERLRENWVKQRLVDQGKARSQSLGWPDVYAYTKALGERALLESRGNVAVSFVRPSIIESALSEPSEGWIRGFRMAEPILIGVGKGLLKSFPGMPEGVLDVIPVDKVVATIIAVAANGPAPTGPKVYQIASGSRQPLRYRNLVDLVQGWYRDNPLYDADGQPILINEWQYPERGRVERQLRHGIKALTWAERLLTSVPLRGEKADLAARLEDKRTQAERAMGYVEIYGAYTQAEVVFRIDNTLALFNSLPPQDQQRFHFDPIDIDWKHYLQDVHMPSIISQGRLRSKPVKKTSEDRATRARRAILSEQRHIAAFDLENTLIRSNVVESYGWLASRRIGNMERLRLTARVLSETPKLLSLDHHDRGDFLRHFYRRYTGAPVEQLREDGWELFSNLILAKSFPAGLRRVREHRAMGHRTLLITGALDVVIAPLMPLFDDVICAHMGEKDGKFTGELIDAPPIGEARALIIRDYAARHGLDLEQSVAYADSASDLPMLEVVGHPVAVNPESKLAAIARRRGWHVEQWTKQGDSPLLALAPSTGGPRGARGARGSSDVR